MNADEASNQTVKADSEHNKTRKVMVITFNRDHWEVFKRKLTMTRKMVPDLDEQGMASAIIAAWLRDEEEKLLKP